MSAPLVLAIDTSQTTTGVALSRGGEVLSSSVKAGGMKHSEALFSQIDEALKAAGADKSGLGLVVVTRGPGSFTGLRVGLATAKGLAFGLGLKMAGVSTLEALAAGSIPFKGTVAAVVDAKKRQVYAAAYDGETGEALAGEGAYSPEGFAAILKGLGSPLLLVGSGVKSYEGEFKSILEGGFEVASEERWVIDPSKVAFIGEREAIRRGPLDPGALTPVYHRLSEAEENKRRG